MSASNSFSLFSNGQDSSTSQRASVGGPSYSLFSGPSPFGPSLLNNVNAPPVVPSPVVPPSVAPPPVAAPRKRVTFDLVSDVVHFDPDAAPAAPPVARQQLTNETVHRFGALPSPATHPHRIGKDFDVHAPSTTVTSTRDKGASLTLNPAASGLKGTYTTIPKGSSIPPDMALRDDRRNGHVSLYNRAPMSYSTHQARMGTIKGVTQPGGKTK